MTRPPVLRAILALIILALTGFFAITKEPRLGLDLRGGTSITLETKDTATTKADAEATDRALEVLRRRVDALGVAEPTLARSGENRIIVELPGVQDAAAAAEAIGQTAQLTFHPVLGPGDPSQVVGPQPSLEPAPLLTAAPTNAPAAPAAAAAPSAPTARRRPQPSAAAVPRPCADRAARRPGRPAAVPSAAASAAPSARPSAAPAPAPSASAVPRSRGRRGRGGRLRPEQGADGPRRARPPILLGPAALTGEGVGDASGRRRPARPARRASSPSTSGATAAGSGRT